jgi:shikimate dehydrogenase
MGAVNIVKKTDDGKLVGDNTDGLGYAESLAGIFGGQKNLRSKHLVILGAGGSGRAIAFALASFGAKVTIVNRTVDKAVSLAESLNTYFGKVMAKGVGRERIPRLIPFADAVVSVVDDALSPLDAYSTLGSMELPVTPEAIEKNRLEAEAILRKAKGFLVVSDIRIRKGQTPMLVQAERLGFKVLDGIPMVVNQGVRAFSFLYKDLFKQKKISTEDINRIMKGATQS